jgi:uncharacterized repeat protein (TIGR03847 family)
MAWSAVGTVPNRPEPPRDRVEIVAAQVFRFESPGRFVAGTVGPPGERTFFLQARDDTRLITVSLEKEQVAVLAERIDAMLDDIVRRTGGAASVPAVVPANIEDTEPLEQPIVEEFRVGTLTLHWDATGQQVVIAAYAVVDGSAGEEPPDDPDESDRDVLVVHLAGGAARAFAKRTQTVVAAGRPPCPLCGLPLDPSGHVCPRQNGYRRRG